MSIHMGIEIPLAGLKNVVRPFRYFAQALDPIHIGTGGERLSRVDMAIVREAGTDLPKLPGTSLSGACRAYAAMQRNEGDAGRNCAGQGQRDGEGNMGHCGKLECPICQTFGYARGDTGGKKGIAQFTDGAIIAFPVASTRGPIWVTSPRALTTIGDIVATPPEASLAMAEVSASDTIALGWLALRGSQPFALPANLKTCLTATNILATQVALVSDDLFPVIVNDNLEVRTSVSIDPGTGAARDGALFTYEAIPTGTLFAFDIIYQGDKVIEARTTVEQGLTLFAWLGIGGMNTRGMGRLRVLVGGAQ